MVDRIALKHCLPLYGLFYLYFLELTLFTLKFSLTQQIGIRPLVEGLWKR